MKISHLRPVLEITHLPNSLIRVRNTPSEIPFISILIISLELAASLKEKAVDFRVGLNSNITDTTQEKAPRPSEKK